MNPFRDEKHRTTLIVDWRALGRLVVMLTAMIVGTVVGNALWPWWMAPKPPTPCVERLLVKPSGRDSLDCTPDTHIERIDPDVYRCSCGPVPVLVVPLPPEPMPPFDLTAEPWL